MSTSSQAPDRPKIIIFSGPPCSGKSTLARDISARMGFPHLQMDEIRTFLIPQSKHSKTDRDIAYRAMHLLADHLLRKGATVILDATYAPQEHRHELEAIACRTQASMFLIECKVPADVAVSRFLSDRQNHPAFDLTPERVKRLVRGFPYFGGGFTLDSTRHRPTCLLKIEQYILHGSPVQPNGEWTRTAIPPTIGAESRHLDHRLTSHAIRGAKRSLHLIRFAWVWFCCVFVLGLLPVVAKGVSWLLQYFWGPSPIASFLGHLQWSVVLAWGALWIPVSVIFGALVPAIEYLRKRKQEKEEIKNAGKTPRYAPVSDTRPADESLYDTYYAKTVSKDRSEGFCVPGVPIYFVIPPRPPFDVTISTGGAPIDHAFLSSEAAKVGLDWNGFKDWRLKEKRDEYDRFVDEPGIRCTDIDDLGDLYSLTVAKCQFSDYICTELSVNLSAPGRLPDMRRLLEGEQWEEGIVELSDIKNAAKRYALITSVSVLITTSGGYLVLQRRSKHISEGRGGLAPTASGFTHWGTDFAWLRRPFLLLPGQHIFPSALRNAALRELREEIGIKRTQLILTPNVFLGAAFNLLHGRDLNFYAHFTSKLNHQQVSKLRSKAKDKWEIASLLFVHVDFIDHDGALRGPFEQLQPECNRHLRGALCSFARSGRLDDVRKQVRPTVSA